MTHLALILITSLNAHAAPGNDRGLPRGSAASEVLVAAEAVAVRAADSFAPMTGPALAAAGLKAIARRPAQGTVNGGTGGAPVELTFDRRAWTIKGGVNGMPVELFIDHENRTIKGGANGSPVDLVFDWSPEKIVMRGGANRSPVELVLDWNGRSLVGYANNSPVRVDFDLDGGTLKGYANHAPIDLAYDKVSGRLSGGLNHRPVDMTLTNLDLSDFLQYFFLFLK
ncbi:MAG: hypothetical protein HY928_10690 [Elusimicrobia bacterium]|nr:hypothetical protein [Elusimicrobiota bacterium]